MKTITEEYRKLNEQLHADRPDYGANGHRWIGPVREAIKALPATSILDYGAGKGSLQKALGFRIQQYDPAVYGIHEPPWPADLVVCTDVLEHIEPECLDAVLDDIRRCTLKLVFLVVATRPAKKTLADGRNAHLIQEDVDWWLEKLRSRFVVQQVNNIGGEFVYIGRPK